MLEVRLLGQFEVSLDGKNLTLPTRNAQSLFAYLVLNAGKAHRREKLAGILWPYSSEENARSNLRHELWRLRKVFDTDAESFFLVDDLTISFQLKRDDFLDVEKFEYGSPESASAEDLVESLSHYQGELLPGFYEEWVSAERDRLAAIYEGKIGRLLELLQFEGRWVEVQDWGMRWIGLGGWPEPAYRALMSAYANTGDISKAVATYERLTQVLQKELGVAPSGQTQTLYKRIKSGKGIEPQKEGLQQKTNPQKSQVEPVGRPYALPKLRRDNLPTPLTSFVGREKEIRQVIQLVSQNRLVTITGPGGVGKTRLAIEVAKKLKSQFKDGVWWVGLASVLKPSAINQQLATPMLVGFEEFSGMDIVPRVAAKALRVPESPGLSILEGILDYLENKHLLLVFDNCEHLVEDCAELAERLLGECPELTILTTSREALGVPGEKAWLLPSLSLPGQGSPVDIKCVFQSEAVCLFIERVADKLPGYQPGDADAETIGQICLHLDGIPLAIELAAARMNMLSVQEIAARLDQRFNLLTGGNRTALPRHQTLRAAIEWSYDLLSESEQTLFRRLSVFAGGFTLAGAEAVCMGQDIHQDEVLTLIGRLVNKSLVFVEPALQISDLPTRYRFLDTICSFGRLKLEEAGETGLMRLRHAEYYVDLAEAAESELLLQDQVHWFKLLRAELDNLHAVVEWCKESNQAENALQLVGALVWFWYLSGSNHEGYELALKALSIPSAVQNKELRAKALKTAGYLQGALGKLNSARQLLEEAISIFRSSKDEADEFQLAWSLQFLGQVFANDQKFDQADAAFQEGVELVRKVKGSKTYNFLFFLGDASLLKGDFARAKSIYEESASVYREIGSKPFLAYPLRRLGYLASGQGDIQAAWKFFLESMTLNYETNDEPGFTSSLVSIAALELQIGKPALAARFCGIIERRLESLSYNILYTDQAEYTKIQNQLPAYLKKADFTSAFSEGWEMSEKQALEIAQGLLR